MFFVSNYHFNGEGLLLLDADAVKRLDIREDAHGELVPTSPDTVEIFGRIAKVFAYEGFDYKVEPITEEQRAQLVENDQMSKEQADTIVCTMYVRDRQPVRNPSEMIASILAWNEEDEPEIVACKRMGVQ